MPQHARLLNQVATVNTRILYAYGTCTILVYRMSVYHAAWSVDRAHEYPILPQRQRRNAPLESFNTMGDCSVTVNVKPDVYSSISYYTLQLQYRIGYSITKDKTVISIPSFGFERLQ
jgi:hypothetical protein